MKNTYEQNGKITKIFLKEDGTFTTVDTSVVKKIKKINWSISVNKWGLYVHGRTQDRKWIYLHRYIMEAKENELVDHKDRNRLNNLKSNLRICTPRMNSYNRTIGKNNQTGVTGVVYSKRDDFYVSQIKENYRTKVLGYSKDFNVAVLLRLQYEKDVFGEELAPQKHLFKKYGVK